MHPVILVLHAVLGRADAPASSLADGADRGQLSGRPVDAP